MQDIKSYIIGFLSCACLFLIMGQTKSEKQIGKFQSAGMVEKRLYVINTATGQLHWNNYTFGGFSDKWRKESTPIK